MPFFVVEVNCFPESDPDIKQSQAAAQAAHKTVGDECAKSGRAEQKMVVGPLRPPGQDDQKNPYRGAEKNEQQYQDPVQPELKAASEARTRKFCRRKNQDLQSRRAPQRHARDR